MTAPPAPANQVVNNEDLSGKNLPPGLLSEVAERFESAVDSWVKHFEALLKLELTRAGHRIVRVFTPHANAPQMFIGMLGSAPVTVQEGDPSVLWSDGQTQTGAGALTPRDALPAPAEQAEATETGTETETETASDTSAEAAAGTAKSKRAKAASA